MLFAEKPIVGHEKRYCSTDLFHYVEMILKQVIQREQTCVNSNYSWLKSRNINDAQIDTYLDELRPMINKMTSQSCAAIAVKLDEVTEERTLTVSGLVTLMNTLMREQDSMQAIQKNMKSVNMKRKLNKVRPELTGREATVSFIV